MLCQFVMSVFGCVPDSLYRCQYEEERRSNLYTTKYADASGP
jgi:hypothetical protein